MVGLDLVSGRDNYYTLTDPDGGSSPGDYRFATQGMFGVDDFLTHTRIAP